MYRVRLPMTPERYENLPRVRKWREAMEEAEKRVVMVKTYTLEEKERMYDQGQYTCPVPPVSTGLWGRRAWITWVDQRGVWSGLKEDE